MIGSRELVRVTGPDGTTLEVRATGGRAVTDHPDTGARLVGVALPHWSEVVDAAQRCADATGLLYLGADVVVDAERGPLILEVNARPGLDIQNITGSACTT